MNVLQKSFYGEIPSRPPFWMMRQAGRYLPEYRHVREGAGGFLDLCYSPEKAAEVTLQPIDRFGMDAAIIFSDILVIPHAMGMEVGFVKGEGPKLTPVENATDADKLKTDVCEFLAPVYEALQLTRKSLSPKKSLFGFVGAPWTLLCYMLEGKGGGEFSAAREKLYTDAGLVRIMVEKLTDAIAAHLVKQVEAGADVLQIFDSWAGLAPAHRQEAMIFTPTRRIVEKVKQAYPNIPIIGFPRGLGASLTEYVEATKVDGVSVDTSLPLEKATKMVPEHCVVQGNLDPLLLASDREETLRQAERDLHTMQGRRYIFNLGHGIVPHTPVEHVAALSALLGEEKQKACA